MEIRGLFLTSVCSEVICGLWNYNFSIILLEFRGLQTYKRLRCRIGQRVLSFLGSQSFGKKLHDSFDQLLLSFLFTVVISEYFILYRQLILVSKGFLFLISYYYGIRACEIRRGALKVPRDLLQAIQGWNYTWYFQWFSHCIQFVQISEPISTRDKLSDTPVAFTYGSCTKLDCVTASWACEFVLVQFKKATNWINTLSQCPVYSFRRKM